MLELYKNALKDISKTKTSVLFSFNLIIISTLYFIGLYDAAILISILLNIFIFVQMSGVVFINKQVIQKAHDNEERFKTLIRKVIAK